jgi:hypothetical protein
MFLVRYRPVRLHRGPLMGIPDLHLIDPASNSPDERQAATRHVLLRRDRGEFDDPATRELLEMLGLVEGETAARYDSTGRRLNPKGT